MAAGLAGLAAAGSTQYVALAGLLALMAGALLFVARLRPPRLHRRLPVAHRADRLPDRRRHPGGDVARSAGCSASRRATASRSPGTSSPARSASCSSTLSDSARSAGRRSASTVGVIGDDHRAEGCRPEDPRRADRRHRRDRRELGLRTSPPTAWRRSARWPAGSRRSACPTSAGRDVPTAARAPRGRSSSSSSPRARPRPAPTPRSTTSGSTRTSTWSASARPTSPPALSGTFVVNGSPTKTQMVDGAGRPQPARAGDHGG